VKREDFIRQLASEGCYLKRYGDGHDLYINPRTGKTAPVPVDAVIAASLCAVVRRHLGLR
jgi:hypothetical protein